MTENTGENDVFIPRIKDFADPLHGIYSKRCLPFIKQELDGNNTGVKSFFNHVKVKYITDDEIGLDEGKKKELNEKGEEFPQPDEFLTR